MESPTIVKRPAMKIVGIQCRTSNARGKAEMDIPTLWGRLFQEDILNKIPHKTSHEIIAYYCDYEGDYTQPYTLVIGNPVSSLDDIPEGMVGKVIPAASYAVFHAIGEHPQSLIQTWRHIWQEDENLHRTYTGDYEVYGDEFTGTPQKVNVFIAVKAP